MAGDRRTCASCGTSNEEDARFCEGCGGSLARVCAACGVEASATARFCRGCGTELGGQPTPDLPAASPVRKTVTVMFADLAGSTTFEENVDAETAREVIGRYHDLLGSTAQRHRAGVTKYIGDGFMAVWGVPETGPDDAAQAVEAAVELQERFVELAARVAADHRAELALRVAVNTGEVVVGAGDADLVGDALNVGARLEAECPRGGVVVGEETWRATRSRHRYESRGQVQVKGRTAAVAVYQWLSGQSEAADVTPFVGRTEELPRLQAVLDAAVAARAARLVTVIGDPGVGKSRLAAEFAAAQDNSRIIEARCVIEGTVALAPMVEVLRTRDLATDIPAGVAERDRLLRDLNGLVAGDAGSVEENFWALRRYVETLGFNEPVVLVLDDIQWADTLLLDFVEHLVEWVQDVPVLVLALARPELREIRPDMVTVSRWVSEAVHLNGLDADATAELAAKVLGAARLPDELLRRLPVSTGGNPLFVRELIGMLAHDGVLVEQPAGWRLTIDVDAIAIPPTIHALLASRLERLDATDRRVLELASVVGSDFSVGTVQALAGADAAAITKSLNRLRRLELAQPSGTYIGNEPVWRFHHVLIRDVAYRRLLKSDRAQLHERLADWVSSAGASVAFDSDEMVARHLEAAYAYRSELGTLDEHTTGLSVRSARHYAASARRALDRDELVSAGVQAARGAALADADPAVHAELLLIGSEAFLSAGDVSAGAPLVDELERISDDALQPWATCYRCQFIVYTAPQRLLEVDARLQGAIDEFSRRADASGLAKAHRVRASARLRLGRVGDGEADLFEALIAARQSGDHRQITAALVAAPGAALWGPSPVPKAGGRCLDVVRMQRMTTAAPSLEATSLRHLAVLELLRGRPDRARAMLGDARQIVADLGLRHGLMETELFAGIIELMEGDPVAAEPHFRTALEGLDALGVGADAGQAAALLARSVLAQGRIDEADRYATESERLAGHNLKTAIAWRAVRAEILSAQGRHDEASAMAREAVSAAAGTDLVLDHAETCLALSRVLAAAGDSRGARAALADAEILYSAKEVAASIGRASDAAVTATQAPARATPSGSRLAITNRCCESLRALNAAMQAHDVGGTMEHYSEEVVYRDHRRIGGEPIRGRDAMRKAIELVFEQFQYFDFRVLAVRGQRLNLEWSRLSDDDGNETITLFVNEADDDGRIVYQVRFDEDDFEGAYRELDRRYYAGEGADFAEAGSITAAAITAVNQGDFDRLRDALSSPQMRVTNKSRSAIPDRSAKDLHNSLIDLQSMVASSRTWFATVFWVSPGWCVTRVEREAVGQDGEHFSWTRILVIEVRDRRIESMCEFDIDDEEAAFAYAEELVRATASRLAVTNSSCDYLPEFIRACRVHDVDGALACFSDRFVYDDRRRLAGDPVVGLDAMRAAIERVFGQYTEFDFRVLAVRGQHLQLVSSRWADDAGNVATTLYVNEIAADGRIEYHGRFDEDAFVEAYGELERRHRAGEGRAVADAAATLAEYPIAFMNGDIDGLFERLTAPGFRVEDRSRSLFGDRSGADFRTTYDELSARIVSLRVWHAAVCWLSPKVVVARFEQDAVGRDGEQFAWTHIDVAEIRAGQFASVCVFDIDDEEAAFAYAEERVRATASRLAVMNRCCELLPTFFDALRAGDVERVVATYADEFVFEDRRRLSGNPITDREGMRAAVARICQQYSRFDFRVLAVRGERLVMVRSRWSDDADNETAYLHVTEINDAEHVIYDGRFDDDDFESAYRELERRYYVGEGSQFATAGRNASEVPIALNRGDLDRMMTELSTPDVRVENRSRSPFPDRSAGAVRDSLSQLDELVAQSRTWISVVCWIAPNLSITRLEREATGQDGERYAWTRVMVTEHRDGRLASMCEFDPDDEESAFAYAHDRVRARASRLAVENKSTEFAPVYVHALRAGDIDGAVDCYADDFEYDDQRRLSGDPVSGRVEMRAGIERFLRHYNDLEWRTSAVRGEYLSLHWVRSSDDAGNETITWNLREVGDDGRFSYHGRFDEDDFAGAYRELNRRYCVGEGSSFTDATTVLTEYAIAENSGDLDRALGELATADFCVKNRSQSVFGNRSAAEFRASREELNAMVDSVRAWHSAIRFVSPTVVVGRLEREAIGTDGEKYVWNFITVAEVRGGQLASTCLFDLDDEDAAFAYAEELVRTPTSRLVVANRASRTWSSVGDAMRARDADGAAALFAYSYVYDDHWAMAGDPPRDVRTACAEILRQYSSFEGHVLAVRGESLQLSRTHWSNDAGFDTEYLHVIETDDDDRIHYYGRFGADDFESAYMELERRYWAGEGAPFAEAARVRSEFVAATDRGDFDRAFGELADPALYFDNRSSSAFPNRSAAELRASLEQLNSMISTNRSWIAVECWLSPTVGIGRHEREAVGHDGETYTWRRILAGEIRGRRIISMCQFDLEDEDAALGYAEELVRAAAGRLSLSNLASRTFEGGQRVMQSRDTDAAVAFYAPDFEFDDRRRFGGSPPGDLRTAYERIIKQYSKFEGRIMAVRGDRLHLGWTRWSNESGFESCYLQVHEVDKSGRVIYEGRFDEEDFDAAYRELSRRYCVGEGEAVAEAAAHSAEYLIAINQRQWDRVFGELTDQDMRAVSRSSSGFPDRSVAELRASYEDLSELVTSMRSWHSAENWVSPTVAVVRHEREAVGRDGERYRWAQLVVGEFRDGRAVHVCEFDLEQEAEAFAYAEERVRAAASRLPITNRAKQTWDALDQLAHAHDFDGLAACFSSSLLNDDRRRWSGFASGDIGVAAKRVSEQYNRLEMRSLAVRGERLHLGWTRYSNDSEFESTAFWVHEVDDDGLILYLSRFDEEDFAEAYRELEQRYYAGEGAAFAAAGVIATEFSIAVGQGDFDRVFGELFSPDFHVENRSRSALSDRSAAGMRAGVEALRGVVESWRTWNSAMCWLSPNCGVCRSERVGSGRDGEKYVWSDLVVFVIRDGRAQSACMFELDDEEAAFAYAEERTRPADGD